MVYDYLPMSKLGRKIVPSQLQHIWMWFGTIAYLYEFPYFLTQSCTVDNARVFSFFLASFGGGRDLLGSVSKVCIITSCKESTTRHRNLCDLSKISEMTWNAESLISQWSFVSCFINALCKGWRMASSDLNGVIVVGESMDLAYEN